MKLLGGMAATASLSMQADFPPLPARREVLYSPAGKTLVAFPSSGLFVSVCLLLNPRNGRVLCVDAAGIRSPRWN